MSDSNTLITNNFTATLLAQAQGVKILFLDVDGVLTDGGIYFSEYGETLKRFHTLDGHGIKLLQQAGITVAVVTGRDSSPLRLRLQNLGVQHAVFGTEDKLPAAQEILRQLQLDWKQAAAMGDDWPDLPLLRRAALALAPLGAHLEAKRLAHYVTHTPAGAGAVREVCDLLLHATGRYAQAFEKYAH